MSRTTVCVAALALAVAGCSGGEKAADKGAPADTERAAAEARADIAAKLQPGEYENTVKVLEFSMAGMPPGASDRMKAVMGGEIEKPHRYCFTPEEAAEGPKRMVSRMQQGDCKTTDFSSTADSISGTLHCSFKGGASSTTRFSGTYRSDGSTMTMESDQQMPGMTGKGMHMKMQVNSRRVGDCAK